MSTNDPALEDAANDAVRVMSGVSELLEALASQRDAPGWPEDALVVLSRSLDSAARGLIDTVKRE